MADLREIVRTAHATPGVVGAAVVGRDGLLIDVAGLAPADAEHVAALAPGLTVAVGALADAAAVGPVRAVVIEGERGVLMAMPLSAEVTLVALLAPPGGDVADDKHGAGAALYALRQARGAYAARA